ncbi:MAG TPA: NTP transferase domain-containing protein [Planctomycetes bacterium]|nr:NTP transferase domain-containing protein [Planctomycetota bacterium]
MIKQDDLQQKAVIITAAGDNSRWGNHLNTLKHLVPIDPSGQTIIGRTVEMLKNTGVDNVFVVSQHEQIIELLKEDVEVITPANCNSLADSILSSRKYWADRTIILLGDVFFSQQCLDKILACKNSIKFFGIDQFGVPDRYKIKRSELYSLSFDSSMQDIIERNLKLNSTMARFKNNRSLRFGYLKMPLVKKTGCLKLLYHYSYPPKPPGLLIKAGFKKSAFWRIARFLVSKPRRTKIYGKLWGLYFTTAGIGLFDSPDYRKSPGVNENNYFEEIDDVTQDIDTKEDYDILLEKLIQARSSKKIVTTRDETGRI